MLHKETVAVLTSIKKRNKLCEQNAVYPNAKLSAHEEKTGPSDICTLNTGERVCVAFKFFTNSNFAFLEKCHFEIKV